MNDHRGGTSRILLPDAPADQRAILDGGGVACWSEPIDIDTYEPAAPDRYPMFLDRRVYQGSSGRVYPIPFVDRIASVKSPRSWRAIHLENRWVRLTLLPEIGGRIHIGYDKVSGYDFFYRNNVIKPALVGLAGPWISGGIEFNWPQHHRPATFLPVETQIERSGPGDVTVWHSDIDPLQRMRGTHGVRLRGDRSTIEVLARLHNRTDDVQTFLWWANVAARSHPGYQSFFPTDVRFVADHARRAITAFPRADRPYYGVDYPALVDEDRPDADRIDRPANIPVPTSYMITDTDGSFFGGYDRDADAGFVHWADRRISPGKKQWTWGSGAVGRAWDVHLTDTDGPYVELMAGVYTDNQPDFSYLAPGETRVFSQYWYPIRRIGPAHEATRDLAASLRLAGEPGGARVAEIGVCSAVVLDGVVVELLAGGQRLEGWDVDLDPETAFTAAVPVEVAVDELSVRIVGAAGTILTTPVGEPRPAADDVREPWVATEPAAPESIASADELYLTGVHLQQNRHPTRSAVPYFEEVLRRDPFDVRAGIALGAWRHRRGEYGAARDLFERALRALTRRNLNPPSGEASYRLGLVLERLGDPEGAAAQWAKAGWDRAWAHPSSLALARLELRRGRPEAALAHARDASRWDSRDPAARHLAILALRALGHREAADDELARVREADALDPVAQALAGELVTTDPGTPVLVATQLARAGQVDAALALTESVGGPGDRFAFGNHIPIAHYLRATWLEARGDDRGARAERAAARASDPTYAFPSGLDDYDALARALEVDEDDALAPALLGCWLLDAGRLDDAHAVLLEAIRRGSVDPVAWRNAAVATVATGGALGEATALLDRALELSGGDGRLVFERDLLAQRRGVDSGERLAAIEAHPLAMEERDDLALTRLELLVRNGRAREALDILTRRRFQPFEGGEGRAIAVYDLAAVTVARDLLASDPEAAVALLRAGAEAPPNLGEGRHPADDVAERLVLLGDAEARAGNREAARAAWAQARADRGPLAVAARDVDVRDYWVGVAHHRLGEEAAAAAVWDALDLRADSVERELPTVDYFATSLPELLLFDLETDDSRATEACALRRLAAQGRRLPTAHSPDAGR